MKTILLLLAALLFLSCSEDTASRLTGLCDCIETEQVFTLQGDDLVSENDTAVKTDCDNDTTGEDPVIEYYTDSNGLELYSVTTTECD